MRDDEKLKLKRLLGSLSVDELNQVRTVVTRTLSAVRSDADHVANALKDAKSGRHQDALIFLLRLRRSTAADVEHWMQATETALMHLGGIQAANVLEESMMQASEAGD